MDSWRQLHSEVREALVQGVQCLELGRFPSSAGNILRYQDTREVFRVSGIFKEKQMVLIILFAF